jgi:cytosine/adenosine deaminase-related metal-dependent hydrolase
LLAPFTARAADKLLVRNATIISEAPGAEPFRGFLRVGGDGRIADVGPGDPPTGVAPERVIDAGGQFVAPGFISAHSHLFQSPLRGPGHDATLYGWLSAINRINTHSMPDDLYWFCLHGSLDYLRNGITTAYDFTYSGGLGGGQHSVGAGEKSDLPAPDQEPFEKSQIQAKVDSGIRFVDSVSIVPLGSEAEIRQRFERILAFAKQFSGNRPDGEGHPAHAHPRQCGDPPRGRPGRQPREGQMGRLSAGRPPVARHGPHPRSRGDLRPGLRAAQPEAGLCRG